VPLIVYNIPYRTGVSLSWRTLRALASVPGVIGLKHAVGGSDADTVTFLAGAADGFAVLGGDDALIAAWRAGRPRAPANWGTGSSRWRRRCSPSPGRP
jgi:dihydrodipicolinate synthase/N-acetylneuraminate lyase